MSFASHNHLWGESLLRKGRKSFRIRDEFIPLRKKGQCNSTGAYPLNNSLLDLIALVGMGMVGYLFRKIDFDVSPMVLALVFGPMLETTFRQSLYSNRGDPLVFLERPISAILLVVLPVVLILPFIRRLMTSRRTSVS